MSWVCTKCGECCRHIGHIPSMKGYAGEDGACKFLGEDNLCTIYEKRPPVCNVAKVYETFFKDKVPEEIFYEKTAEACRLLQKGIVSSHEDREPSEH